VVLFLLYIGLITGFIGMGALILIAISCCWLLIIPLKLLFSPLFLLLAVGGIAILIGCTPNAVASFFLFFKGT
jgi:hypothetical protein